jgi:hypothetical protein
VAARFPQGESEIMLLTICKSVTLMAAGGLLLASAPASPGGKDKPALTGVWQQSGGELKLAFADKDVMKIYPHGDKVDLAIVCKCTLDKKGVVKATITDYEGKDELKQKVKEVVPVGQTFSFTWQVKDDAATLSDVQGDKVGPLLKSHLEGKYDKK